MISFTEKHLPPAPLASINFDIARPEEFHMPNGLRVVVFTDTRNPLLNVRLAFFSGDRDDYPSKIGLTTAMTNLLTEGTYTYTSAQLAEKIERLGASIGASSSDDFTRVSGAALSLYSDELFDLLSEVLLRPTFPENEVELYKANSIENLRYQRSQSNFLAGERINAMLYGDHPYSVYASKLSDIEAINIDDLFVQHRERVVPDGAVLIIVGDIEADEARSALDARFADWNGGGFVRRDAIEPRSDYGRRTSIVDRPGSTQSNIVMANLAVKRDHPDYFPLLVMNQILGAGASSRVFMNLREEKGYTYGAYTRMNLKQLSGDVEATAEVRNEVTGESIKEFLFEFDRIRNELVSDDEIADAKSFLTGVFPIRAETQDGLTGLIVNQYLYGLPNDYLQTYRENVNAITREQVLDAARLYIRPDEMSTVIVGDAESIAPQIEPLLGEFAIYDAEGNLKG